MSEKYIMPRLGNDNYQTWKLRMTMMLKREELWHTVGDAQPQPVTAAWTNQDQKALATIVLFVDDGQLSLVKDAVCAKDAWEQLRDYHEKATTTSRVALLKKVCSLDMSDGGNMQEHLFELENLFDRLSCAGLPLDEPMKIAMTFRSLPDSYGSLVTALESRPDADQTIVLVKQKLLDEHQRRVERGGVSEKVMKSRSEPKERVCYHCRKPGHFKRNCRLWQQCGDDEQKSSKKSDTKAKQVTESESPTRSPICFTVGSKRQKNYWYVDSGCSSHMCNSRKFFRELSEDISVNVVLADGSVTAAAGIGEGVISCVDGNGEVREIVMKEVLYIPSLDSNLLSVRKITQRGLKVQFVKAKCEIVRDDGEVIAVAKASDNLFQLVVPESARISEEMRHNENCPHTWHRRFGHRDPRVLDRIQAEGLVTGLAMHDCGIKQVCEDCLKGKLPRNSFPKISESRAKRVGDLVHTDVCGPVKDVTPGGYAYFMTLIDDFSRYTVVCLLRNKSDAAGCIKQYVAHVKNRFGRAPCVIRSDGGGEYVNNELKLFYEQEGIEAQFTAAYSPQQNGIAERKNRTLQEMASCMLLDAGLPKKYWGEAVMTATYVQNRLPSRSVDTTPYQKWFGEKPSVEHMKVFGSLAYVHIPNVRRTKMDAKSQKLVFMGYCSDRKAYRFVDPETDKLTISRDARFLELRNGSLERPGSKVRNTGFVEVSLENGRTKIQEEPAIIDHRIQEERTNQDELEEDLYYDTSEDPPNVEEGSKRSTRGALPKRLKDYIVGIALATNDCDLTAK